MVLKCFVPTVVRSRLEATMDFVDGYSALLKLDRLTPILEELLSVRPGNNQHPSCRQLFSWLMEPKRSVEEFLYVFVKLGHQVGDPWFDKPDARIYFYARSMATMAIEVLAAKCPVLNGPWELLTWYILGYYLEKFGWSYSDDSEYRLLSDHACSWVIHVIGDADLCPNVNLRIELMLLMSRMINVNEHGKPLAFESMVSACFELNVNIDICDGHLNFTDIVDILEEFGKDKFLIKICQNIASELNNVKTRRLLTLYNDISYKCALNSSLNRIPNEMYFLISLIRTFDCYVQEECKQNQANGESVLEVARMLKVIMCNFPKSCQMPQLLHMVVSCIMDVVEYVLVDFLDDWIDQKCVEDIESVLQDLTIEDGKTAITASVIGREILCNYSGRLNRLKERMNSSDEEMEALGLGPLITKTMILELLN